MLLVHDDIFEWEGFGGKLQLGSGRCRLRIFDRNKGEAGKLTHLRPLVVVVTDVAGGALSVRSCAGHIATSIVRRFGFAPHRIQYVEYSPTGSYGSDVRHVIPARYEAVDFEWVEGKALRPAWHPLEAALEARLRVLLPAEAEEGGKA